MDAFPFLRERVLSFRNIVVYPSQEVTRSPAGAFFRGGPAWPHFATQLYARQCWGPVPIPVDSVPHPSNESGQSAEIGIWCGPVSHHFGHQVADFGMRLASSSRLDPSLPLVFSFGDETGRPQAFHAQILDHLGVDRCRVMAIERPTRFARLLVLPQAERRGGGSPTARHLRFMDKITLPAAPSDRDLSCVFVSRALRSGGRFAGESYLDEVLTAAGITVFHPETSDLANQLRTYRRAQRLVFTEGSALYTLQLIGHIDAHITVLARRPNWRLAAASLQPRVHSLNYLRALRGVVCGLLPSGHVHEPAGLSILDERKLITGFQRIGIDIAPLWETQRHAERRDADLAAWIADRLAARFHPGERRRIERRLCALALGYLVP